MPNYKKTTKAGNVLEVEVFHSRTVGKRVPRQPNTNETPEDKKQRNLFQARRKLSHLINANFSKNDLFLTLTFRGKQQPTYETAEKALRQFTRAIRTIRKLRGYSPLKYVAVIEDSTRPHIHMVMSKMNIDEVFDVWEHGKVLSSRLEPNGEYTGLAYYITKDPKRDHKKRWSQSRNLHEPVPEYEEISKAEAEADIEKPQGYRLVYHTRTYIDEIGLYQYSKFVRHGKVDLALGAREIEEARRDE